jgi:hypothetical protein
MVIIRFEAISHRPNRGRLAACRLICIWPRRGFLDWTSDQWETFFETDPESAQLGKSLYICWVLGAISHNLEGDKPRSGFPMLMRMETSNPIGWYANEIPALVREVGQIKAGLQALPVSRLALNCESDDEVRQRVDDFRRVWPGRAVRSVYDLHFYFFEEFEKLAARAVDALQGLYVAF